MNLNYLPLYSGVVAIISIVAAVTLSRRGWSLLRGSLVLLALTSALAIAAVVCVQSYQASSTEGRSVPWLELLGAISAAAAAGFCVACVSVFVTACVTASLRTYNRKSKSNVA